MCYDFFHRHSFVITNSVLIIPFTGNCFFVPHRSCPSISTGVAARNDKQSAKERASSRQILKVRKELVLFATAFAVRPVGLLHSEWLREGDGIEK